MQKREIIISPACINDAGNCFVIAEIGHNHQGSFENCKKMFEAARECGVDAVKLQKRNIDELYTRQFLDSPYNTKYSYGATYGLHRKKLEFSPEQFKELKEYAEQLGLIFCSTAFDFASADFLESINLSCFKVASGDLTNIPLLEHIARKGKPMIISTGASTLEDVTRAYNAVSALNQSFAFLQCTAAYPSEYSELDLKVIETYRRHFPETVIGFSAHDTGFTSAIGAFVLGARIIEKHFTLDNSLPGTDHIFSLNPDDMKNMVKELKNIRQALGSETKTFYPSEKPARLKMGKKIVAAGYLAAGHILTSADLKFKSPGDGLEPYHAGLFYGKKLKTALNEDDALQLEFIEE
jgi:sialic acid synthase